MPLPQGHEQEEAHFCIPHMLWIRLCRCWSRERLSSRCNQRKRQLTWLPLGVNNVAGTSRLREEMAEYEEEYASKQTQGEPESPPSPYGRMDESYTSQDDMDTGDLSKVHKPTTTESTDGSLSPDTRPKDVFATCTQVKDTGRSKKKKKNPTRA